MFDLIVDVMLTLFVTTGVVLILDYLFGTDKFISVREYINKTEVLACSLVMFMLFGLAHVCGHYFNLEPLHVITLTILTIIWFAWWCYFTGVYVSQGVKAFRKNNLLKRKKPR